MGKYEDLRAMREAKARDLKHPQHPELGLRVIHPDQERDLIMAVEKPVNKPLKPVNAPAKPVNKKRGPPPDPKAERRDMAAYMRKRRAKAKDDVPADRQRAVPRGRKARKQVSSRGKTGPRNRRSDRPGETLA